MFEVADAPDVRLALLALFAAVDTRSPLACARILNRATGAAAEMADAVTPGHTTRARTTARLGAVRLINSLCGACAACPRGRTGDAPAEIMSDPPAAAA